MPAIYNRWRYKFLSEAVWNKSGKYCALIGWPEYIKLYQIRCKHNYKSEKTSQQATLLPAAAASIALHLSPTTGRRSSSRANCHLPIEPLFADMHYDGFLLSSRCLRKDSFEISAFAGRWVTPKNRLRLTGMATYPRNFCRGIFVVGVVTPGQPPSSLPGSCWRCFAVGRRWCGAVCGGPLLLTFDKLWLAFAGAGHLL